jgi:hypothetical protein
VKRALAGWAYATGLATLGLLVARLATSWRSGLVLDVYLLTLGGLSVLVAVVATRRAFPVESRSALAAALEHEAEPPLRPAELVRLEREATLAVSSAFDLHYWLRPALRTIAEDRLARHGLELDAGGPAVEEVLGEELWELVRPDRAARLRRDEPSLKPGGLRRVVERLETI